MCGRAGIPGRVTQREDPAEALGSAHGDFTPINSFSSYIFAQDPEWPQHPIVPTGIQDGRAVVISGDFL